MVMLLLQFTKAERTGDWPLRLRATSEMIPYFLALDRRSYARWNPVYLTDVTALSSKHPLAYMEFMDGNHSVSRSNPPL